MPRHGTRLTIGVLALVALPAAAVAQDLSTVTIRFTGSGSMLGSVVSDMLPAEGLIGCGEFLNGAPGCQLLERQQCCKWEIDAGNQGAMTRLLAQATRAPSGGGVAYFMSWGGACAQAPRSCEPSSPTMFNPWCVGGQDFRGEVDPTISRFTCDVVLPTSGNVEVSLDWNLVDGQYLVARTCNEFNARIGTCNIPTNPSSTTTTTSTTLPDNGPPTSCRLRVAARQLLEQFVPNDKLYPVLEAFAANRRPTLQLAPDPDCPGKVLVKLKMLHYAGQGALTRGSSSVTSARAAGPQVVAKGTTTFKKQPVTLALKPTRYGKRLVRQGGALTVVLEATVKLKKNKETETLTVGPLTVPAPSLEAPGP